jgi:chromosome partitioning protein
MKIWAIESQKGGSGKTTTAVHMAICAARRGLRTALIDIDIQRSASNWNDSRPPEQRLDCVAGTAAQLSNYIEKARAGGIELVIIDTAPHSNADGAIAAQLADLVLIPCRPARFDLDAVLSTLQIVRAANTPAVVIINAAPRGKLAAEAKSALERQGATVVETVLHQRAAYSHAVIDGRSVHEYEPNGAATAEIDALYNHITRLHGASRNKKARVA